jgi:hypothetical protein
VLGRLGQGQVRRQGRADPFRRLQGACKLQRVPRVLNGIGGALLVRSVVNLPAAAEPPALHLPRPPHVQATKEAGRRIEKQGRDTKQ